MNDLKKVKVACCEGEGQGSCKRCVDKGIWNRMWMSFLYKIEGFEGCYCAKCVDEIMGGKSKCERYYSEVKAPKQINGYTVVFIYGKSDKYVFWVMTD